MTCSFAEMRGGTLIMAQKERVVGTAGLASKEEERARRHEVEIGSMEGKAVTSRGEWRFTNLPRSGLVQRMLSYSIDSAKGHGRTTTDNAMRGDLEESVAIHHKMRYDMEI
jgi:hypothetical protein